MSSRRTVIGVSNGASRTRCQLEFNAPLGTVAADSTANPDHAIFSGGASLRERIRKRRCGRRRQRPGRGALNRPTVTAYCTHAGAQMTLRYAATLIGPEAGCRVADDEIVIVHVGDGRTRSFAQKRPQVDNPRP
jgi:hypothetical protein